MTTDLPHAASKADAQNEPGYLRFVLAARACVARSVRIPYALLTVTFSLVSRPLHYAHPERPRDGSMHGKR